MAGIDDRIKTLERNVGDIKEENAGTRVRLDNGIKVFSKVEDRLTTLEERTQPRSPSIGKIVGVTLAIVMTGAGSLWALANNLRDRPTVDQMETAMERRDKSHEDGGHKDIRVTVDSIKKEQGAQRALIDRAYQQQSRDTKKLDILIRRLPPPRNRRRR